jgi:AraC family transcriptional regulator
MAYATHVNDSATPMRRIELLLEYIRTHLDHEMSVGVLAARAGFSPFHFQRIFRLAVGQTIGEYVRGRRLQRAAIDLRGTEKPVTDIALESGYDTASAFTRAFSNAYGVPPSAFRADAASPQIGSAMEFRIERLGSMRVLAMRQVGPYSHVAALWPRFVAHLSARGLMRDPLLLGLSYDDPDTVDLQQLRYDACVVTDAEPDEQLYELCLPEGRYAIYRHDGPYALISHHFDRFIDQLVFREAFELRDAACMEIYRNDQLALDPSAGVVDLAVPIV